MQRANNYLSFGLISVFIFLDQLTKMLSQKYVLNEGISFGLFSNLYWEIIILFLLFFAGCWLFQLPTNRVQERVFFILILGGGVSNWLDRVVFGGVRDIWTVPFFGWHNNLADWFIFIGVIFGVQYIYGKSFSHHRNSS